MNVWLVVYLALTLHSLLAFSQLTGNIFKTKSLTGLLDNKYFIGSLYSVRLKCIKSCANIKNCHIVSYSSDGKCSFYSIDAYFKFVFSYSSTVYIKQTYLSKYLNALSNCWIGSNDGFDVISGSNLYGGVNVQSTTNKNGEANSAFLFDSGCYQVPAGVYFYGDFTISAWIKLTRYGRHQRLIDFGNGGSDNIIITVSDDVYEMNNVKFFVSNNFDRKTIFSVNQLRLGFWEHVTVVLKAKENTGYIYINGILDVFGEMLIPNYVTRLNNYLGRSNWYPYDPDVSASISNIRIFSKALSSTEIKSNMDLFG